MCGWIYKKDTKYSFSETDMDNPFDHVNSAEQKEKIQVCQGVSLAG